MTTPTTPSPLQILLAPTPVRLTAKLVGEALELLYEDIPLSQHGNTVSIRHDGTEPVKVEIYDFDDAAGHWTLTAAPKGNASLEGNAWARGEGLCCSTHWNETDGAVRIDVTATNAAGVSRVKPVFIEVPPKGVRPWE